MTLAISSRALIAAPKAAILSALALAAVASPCFAQVHAGDVVLDTSTGVIRTGELAPNFVEKRVFVTLLGAIAPNFASDPGFDCVPVSFVPGSRNTFRILDALRVWNETDFSELPPEQLEIARGPASVLTPLTASTVEGFALQVGANGQWHRHYEFTLLPPAGQAQPADGVYLLALSLRNDHPSGPQESMPFYILFGQNSTQAQLVAADQYVRTVLLASGPTCDSIDFNNDSLFPDDQDLIDFLSVLAGGPCSTSTCNDIDYNNDDLFPDDGDLIAFLRVLAGGEC
jgi:hypothetical protein